MTKDNMDREDQTLSPEQRKELCVVKATRNYLYLVIAFLSLCFVGPVSSATPKPPTISAGVEKVDVTFPQAISLAEIYTSTAKAAGWNVLIDPEFKDHKVAIELEGVTLEEFLQKTTKTYQHYYAFVDEETIVITNDTPQNRRRYESQVIETFYLNHAQGADMMTILRSILSVKHIAFDSHLNALVIRDSAERVAIAKKLIENHEHRPGEVRLKLEVLSVDALKLEGVRERSAKAQNRQGFYIAREILDELRQDRHSEILAQPELQLLENKAGTIRLADQVQTTEDKSREQGMELKTRVQIEPEEDIVLAELRWMLRHPLASDCAEEDQVGERSITTHLSLEEGKTYLLTGILRTVKSEGEAGQQKLSGLGCGKPTKDLNEWIVALTPQIIYRPNLPTDDEKSLWIGTETHQRLGD